MFELRIQEPKVANNPTVAVRWCIGRQESNWLLEKKIEQPHVLIVVCYEQVRFEAYLEPIDKLMTYVSFRYPGRHQILALIVWPQISDADKRRGRFMRAVAVADWKRHVLQPEWSHNIQYSYDKKVFYFWKRGKFGENSPFSESPTCTSTVEVAKEYFAPAQRNWLWRWVNLWYNAQPKDQCQFRQRMILAFTLQPIVECLLIILKELSWVVALVCGWGFFGWREMKPKVLWAPWRYSFADVFGGKTSSWWLEDRNGRKRPFFVMFFHPLALCGDWYVFNWLSQHLGLDYWETVVWLAQKTVTILWFVFGNLPVQIALICFAAGLLLAYLIQKGMRKTVDVTSPEYQDRMRRFEEQKELSRRRSETQMVQYYADLYKSAACVAVPKSPSLESLQPEKRTFVLRFLDFKAKVCKPFAG